MQCGSQVGIEEVRNETGVLHHSKTTLDKVVTADLGGRPSRGMPELITIMRSIFQDNIRQ